MRYYKIIKDNDTFITVITEKDFRKYQKANNILLVCDSKNAEYVRFGNILYRDKSWMPPVVKNDKYKYEEADIINITEEEYNALLSAIKRNEEIKVITDEEIVEEVKEDIVEEEKDITVDYVKNVKILDMSIECNKTITDGFDITLSDGNLYHFSLSMEDQINLLNINNTINTSNDKIIYHADGERCRYFSREDMKMIIDKALKFKTYHTTYFNGLKSYIQSLNDIIVINNITYGIKLPDKFTHVFLTEYEQNNR